MFSYGQIKSRAILLQIDLNLDVIKIYPFFFPVCLFTTLNNCLAK